jgi:hypothetical protein
MVMIINRVMAPSRGHFFAWVGMSSRHPLKGLARSCFQTTDLEAKSTRNGSSAEHAWSAPSREAVSGSMMLSQVA